VGVLSTTGIIVQARLGSTRLPNKVMKEINGTPLIELLLKRLTKCNNVNFIILATSHYEKNVSLIDHVKDLGFPVFVGSENNVLERYLQCAQKFGLDTIVRITGDCPLVDPDLIDKMLLKFEEQNVDYLSNTLEPTFPDGLDVEIFDQAKLNISYSTSKDPANLEHVTPFLKSSDLFSRYNYKNDQDISHLRWTVDEPEDFEVIKNIFTEFANDIHFGWNKVLQLEKRKPNLFTSNKFISRNEGYAMSNGQKLWKRAKKVIPGGNMLLSKRPEMFAPDQWPTYFNKASGCSVWDLEGNHFYDMSIMGIGTNILGYANPEVDDAVRSVISLGNMSSLNCPEEVELAEKLISINPWSDMVRFARSGGEANAIAVRIARAASGRDNVAFCGYHGWHDWYLSANCDSDSNLSGHLLPGLSSVGVPANLKETAFPFRYNKFDELEELVASKNIGVIAMEVSRNFEPDQGYLQKVRALCDSNGIVLIYDECSSGFRETFGGLHIKYDVQPDLAMFGKALGNGYAVTAVVGRKEVMEVAQSTFISSTFWTERIGSVAAIKTLEIMERTKSWELISETGASVTNKWNHLAKQYNLPISTFGLPALTTFKLKSPNWLSYKTLITQEMLKYGFLASNTLYVSTAHNDEIIQQYFSKLEKVFRLISDCEQGRDVKSLLDGPICHDGFYRLN
jgi:glutamate-1-semialdehyde 2,1-aminomutase